MPAGLAFLSAESGAKSVDQSMRHRHRLAIQLPGLRKIGLILKVGRFKKIGGTLRGISGKNGRIHLNETALLEKGMNGIDDSIAHTHGGPLTLAAQPQMAVLHQKIHAVLFGCNRIIFGNLHHLNIRYLHLMAANTALIFNDFTGDFNGAFLPESVRRHPGLRADPVFGYHALAEAGAVAQLQEIEIFTASEIIDPSLQGYFLAFMISDIAN